ncbi:MAG: hypothetical protein OER90_04440 [Gemmatimonadota bacterium]|nr:hypothetical protein [Gemmatimonadota bacterium]
MSVTSKFCILVVVTLGAPGCAAVAGQGVEAGLTASDMEQQLMAAAVDTIAAMMSASAVICVTLLGGPDGPVEPTRGFLDRLSARQEAVPSNECPETYQSMVTPVDSLGRPKVRVPPAGYVDPYQLAVGRPQFEAVGYAWIHARQVQGTHGQDHLCMVESYRGRIRAHCTVVGRWVS